MPQPKRDRSSRTRSLRVGDRCAEKRRPQRRMADAFEILNAGWCAGAGAGADTGACALWSAVGMAMQSSCSVVGEVQMYVVW